MANLQPQLEAFDRAIRLETMDEDALLRDKRDRLLRALNKGLQASFRTRNLEPPRFTPFNQGSYAMRTGIRPISGEYDIDVGIVFDIGIRNHPNPVEVKTWVFDALSKGARDVRMRRSCVTVTYTEGGRPTHHVDLAVYGKDRRGRLHLARGVINSDGHRRAWEPADPHGLIRLVQNHLDGAEREQFRRTVRFLKRWRDVSFPSEGNAAPVGIGLTVLALTGFRPMIEIGPDSRAIPDDLAALERFIRWMLRSFEWVLYDGALVHRLPARLPVTPNSNVLLRMTNKQMGEFETKLRALHSALAEIRDETNLLIAGKNMQSVVGGDFPLAKVRKLKV